MSGLINGTTLQHQLMVIVQQVQELIALHVVVVTVVEVTIRILLIIHIHLIVHPQTVLDPILVAVVDNHLEE